MTNEKYFSVIVGEAGVPVQIGWLDADSGQPKNAIDGFATKGELGIPNYSRNWGKEKKVSGKLTGEFELMPWGDPNGEIIELRFLPTVNSLLVSYQNEKKIKLRDIDSEIGLSIGVNNYDKRTQSNLVRFLEAHYQNGTSESRDPSAEVAFSTYNPGKIISQRRDEIIIRREAEAIVLEANYDDERLSVIASLFAGLDPREQPDILYDKLWDHTQNNAEFFLSVVEHHRTQFERLLIKSKELQLIDCESEEAIYIMKNGHKEFLIKDIKPVGTETTETHVLKYFYKPDFFLPLNNLKKVMEAYEKDVLQ